VPIQGRLQPPGGEELECGLALVEEDERSGAVALESDQTVETLPTQLLGQCGEVDVGRVQVAVEGPSPDQELAQERYSSSPQGPVGRVQDPRRLSGQRLDDTLADRAAA